MIAIERLTVARTLRYVETDDGLHPTNLAMSNILLFHCLTVNKMPSVYNEVYIAIDYYVFSNKNKNAYDLRNRREKKQGKT